MENPSGFTCFSKQDVRSLANYKKNCDVVKLNLIDTKTTLEKCVNYGAPASSWWADPKIVVGGIAISFGVGALLGALAFK